MIRKHGERTVRIEGHTDPKGAHDDVELSERLAETVKDRLVKKGALGGALTAEGLAETQPVAPNQNADGSDDSEGRQKNHRQEL